MNYFPETSYKETLECFYAVHEGNETKGNRSIKQSIINQLISWLFNYKSIDQLVIQL